MSNTLIVKPQPGDEVVATWAQSVADAHNGIQGGTANVSFPGGTAISDVLTVTFPRPYATPPIVIATAFHATIGANVNVGIRAITTTNFQVQAREVRESATSGALGVSWLAMGLPA